MTTDPKPMTRVATTKRSLPNEIRTNPILGAVGVGLFVLAARFFLIAGAGNPTPYWDQWEAEASFLYKPWLMGRLSAADLFSAHNEHRIFTTRVFDLFLFEVNGRRWSPIHQMLLSAVVQACAIAYLTSRLGRSVPEKSRWWFYGAIAAFSALPFGWQNTLSGFQVQFYFMFVFSLVCVWEMASQPVGAVRWWLGVLSGVLASLSLAPGPVALIAGSAAFPLRNWLNDRSGGVTTGIPAESGRRHSGVTGLVALVPALCALAFVSLTPAKSPLSHMSPSSIGETVSAFLGLAAWPVPMPVAGLLVQLPLVICSLRILLRRGRPAPSDLFFLCLGLWWFGQLGAMTLSRGLHATESRYRDFLALGVVLNAAALFVATEPLARTARAFNRIAWLTVIAGGALVSAPTWVVEVEMKDRESSRGQLAVTSYLCTGNPRHLEVRDPSDLPYWDRVELKQMLDDPLVQSFLPEALFVPGAGDRCPAITPRPLPRPSSER